MGRQEIISYLGEDWNRVTALMQGSLHTDVALLKRINGTIMENSGKMLRPMISLLVARALGEVNDDSIRYAAGAELLHNATLMHDDVADNSPERRGRPTVSSMLGPDAAVLIGDFWLARAVEVVIGSAHRESVVNFFSKTLSDLSEGEILQLEKTFEADTSEEDYFRIIYCKTASLFEATSAAAAESVSAPEECSRAAKEFGRLMGMAFQIKDDILDYAGTDELGKPLGIDLLEQKITLPLLGALKDSPEEARIRGLVREIHSDPANLETVRRFVWDNGGIDYASRRLDEFIEKAVSALDAFPDTTAKKYLEEIVRFNSFRQV